MKKKEYFEKEGGCSTSLPLPLRGKLLRLVLLNAQSVVYGVFSEAFTVNFWVTREFFRIPTRFGALF